MASTNKFSPFGCSNTGGVVYATLVIGAAIGWLTYSIRWWLSATGILIVLSVASMVFSVP
jgi:hypothetical protein